MPLPHDTIHQDPSVASEHGNPASPGSRKRRRIITGAVILFIGLVILVGGAVPGIIALLGSMNDGQQFAAPGDYIMHIDEPGSYTIWHETSGVFQGQVHSSRRLPSGMQIEVVHEQSGEQIPVRSSTSGSVTIGSTERRSLAVFQADRPGDYRIRAHDAEQVADGAGGVRAVLFVGPEFFVTFIGAIGLIICSGSLGMIVMMGGIIIIVIGAASRAQP